MFEVVLALGPPGGFAGLLDSGQKQRDEDRDDRDDDQEFNEGKATPVARHEARHAILSKIKEQARGRARNLFPKRRTPYMGPHGKKCGMKRFSNP